MPLSKNKLRRYKGIWYNMMKKTFKQKKNEIVKRRIDDYLSIVEIENIIELFL